MENELTLDEWLQLAAAEKVARELGYDRFTWEREPGGGLIMGMGKSNVNEDGIFVRRRGTVGRASSR